MDSKVGSFEPLRFFSRSPADEREKIEKQSLTPTNQVKSVEINVLRKSEDDAVRVTLGDRKEVDSKPIDIRDLAKAKLRKLDPQQTPRRIEDIDPTAPGEGQNKSLSGSYRDGKFSFDGSNVGGEYFRRDDGRLGFTIGKNKRFEGYIREDGIAVIKDTVSGRVVAANVDAKDGRFTLSKIAELDPSDYEG